ncbi:putative holin [Pusillimonas sp. ANT_WB101]|uniref:putative holin n=1 Tax=Pusillimonas sp. ANT_WB101 TaxID=2597356 RepID=UPI0011F09258|nr:putative holin [Pusillimonas sp. ANT_WB101]KAA0910693.1 hypothetical protein FQ179_02110 [Pusillimonas sp. ANT_WB101]
MEPTSSAVSQAVVTWAPVALAALMPGVDGGALIGAFGGSVVFALHTTDVSILKRFIYMIVSLVIGYLAAPEVAHLAGVESTTVPGFLASAFVVTVALAGIEKIKAFDVMSFVRAVIGKRG